MVRERFIDCTSALIQYSHAKGRDFANQFSNLTLVKKVSISARKKLSKCRVQDRFPWLFCNFSSIDHINGVHGPPAVHTPHLENVLSTLINCPVCVSDQCLSQLYQGRAGQGRAGIEPGAFSTVKLMLSMVDVLLFWLWFYILKHARRCKNEIVSQPWSRKAIGNQSQILLLLYCDCCNA